MFPYMQFLSVMLSLLFTLCEMKSRIYKAKSGDAPQVTRLTAGKAAGVVLGGLYWGLWPWLLGAKKSPSGKSHVNRAQFTCETRTFQDAQRHKGSSVVATVAAQAQGSKTWTWQWEWKRRVKGQRHYEEKLASRSATWGAVVTPQRTKSAREWRTDLKVKHWRIWH